MQTAHTQKQYVKCACSMNPASLGVRAEHEPLLEICYAVVPLVTNITLKQIAVYATLSSLTRKVTYF